MHKNLSGLFRRSPATLPHASQELAAMPNRIVVFGSNTSGAPVLSRMLQEYMEQNNIAEPVVEMSRNAGYIDDVFFGRSPNNPTARLIPKGVVALPKMRQYGPHGRGMTIETPVDYIQKLCDDNEVPFVRIEAVDPEGIAQGIGALVSAQQMPREIQR